MKMLENIQDDFDFNYKTLKSQGGTSSLSFSDPGAHIFFLQINMYDVKWMKHNFVVDL